MKKIFIGFLSIVVLCGGLGALFAQGTAISYQGRLTDNLANANGNYDFRFVVFDAEVDGAQQGQIVTHDQVAVENGQFRLPLDFGPGVFNGAPRWLQISARQSGNPIEPHVALSPRRALLPTPYAIYAGSAGSVPNGTVAAGQLNTGGVVPLSGQILSFDGTKLSWRDPAAASGDVFSLNGTNAYYTAGNVGLGTSTPTNRLTVVTPTDSYGLEVTDGNVRLATFVGGSTGGGWLGTISNHKLSYFVNDGSASMTVDTNGNVGIGTTTPLSKLELVGQDALTMTGYQPLLTFRDSNAGNARGRIQSVGGGLSLFTETYMSGASGFAFMTLNNSGNVGIGSANPVSRLEIVGQDALSMIGYQPLLTFQDSNAGYARSRVQGVNGDLALETEDFIRSSGNNPRAGLIVLKNGTGNVGIGTSDPQARLDVAGTTRTCVLSIIGGCDVAEPFPMKSGELPKGSVVVIDDEHPGRLMRSERAYDTRVAGIISGANGINSGITLQQEGALDQGQNVALSGRVYVLADATHGAIKPGDLLTTSDSPGHAMKAADATRAQGAILGKAMSPLGEGKGMVLALVTLQ